MAQEIKFTSFGIPYILEFENVSFVPEQHRKEPRRDPPSPSPDPRHTSPSRSSSTSSFCYIESPAIPPRFPSFSLPSLFKRKPNQHLSHSTTPAATSLDDAKPLPLPPHSDPSDIHGIYIQFPLECSHPQISRKKRLAHLQQAISVAVLNAGMSSSPGNNTHLEKHSGEKKVHGSRGHRTTDALFCGTYGQLMSALEGAGLSATSCMRDPGLSGHTRLGALFVARNDGANGVQLRKIALWG